MGSMIGPITLTVGQPYKVQLAQDTAYLELQNDSLYDVWVYFGDVAPTDLTNANGTWHRVVRRQHNGVLPVEGNKGASASERRNNTIGAFRGTLWLLAVNPGGLALTGTVSGRSQVYLTPYALGDGLPAHSSLSTQTDLTSQPRVVTVPISMLQYAAGGWAPASSTTLTIATLLIPAALVNLAQGFNLYLYSCFFASYSTGQIQFQLQAQTRNSSHVNLGTPVLIQFVSVASDSTTHVGQIWEFQSPWPLCTRFGGVGFPLDPATAEVAIQLGYWSGDKPPVAYSVATNVDSANVTPVAEIGNFGLWYQGTTNAPSF